MNYSLKVNAYDFRSLAIAVAIPYGIYNLLANTGFVVIGISYNTAEFAVSSIAKWWDIKTTKTSTGLEVDSVLDETEYEKGIKISDKEMNKINIEYHEMLPEWNYIIYPSKSEVILR